MLSRTAEYALRAIVVLARQYGQPPVSNDEIAAILGAPRNYLSKTMNTLSRSGIVTSIRGPGGGFSLAIAPEMLTIGDIADVFTEPLPQGARCLVQDGRCNPRRPCFAHRRWTEIQEATRAPLRSARISELCQSTSHPSSKECTS